MFRKREKGQSLIEVTFFLIILLILVAGIVEVGAILQTKLTVVNSAREGARFGTVGASDEDITLVTQTSASNVINYRDDNADIWVIRTKTDGNGDIADACPSDLDTADSYWCVSHEVGAGSDEPDFLTYAIVAGDSGLLKGIKGTQYIGVAVSYDHQSIIGLPYAVGGGGMPVNSYTFMPQESNDDFGRCMVWPLAVHTSTVNWPDGWEKGTLMADIANGAEQGNFGWLSWNGEVNAGTLSDNLLHPENSLSNYVNPADETDTNLSVGDWVQNTTGWKASEKDEIQQVAEQTRGTYVRIIVWDTAQKDWDDSSKCSGNNCVYKVAGFAIVELTGDMTSCDHQISAKFIRFDDSCQ
jgi:hypothetical protein